MYKTLSAPVTLQWEVTPDCNHNCVHCYNHWRNLEQKNDLGGCNVADFEVVSQEVISSKVFAVNITGGEPLLVIEQEQRRLLRFYQKAVFW